MKTINKIVGIVTSISLAGIMSCCSNDLTEKVYSSITQDSYEYTVKDFKSVVSSVYSPLRGVFSHTGVWTANEVIGILSWLILKNFGIGCIGELYLLIIL